MVLVLQKRKIAIYQWFLVSTVFYHVPIDVLKGLYYIFLTLIRNILVAYLAHAENSTLAWIFKMLMMWEDDGFTQSLISLQTPKYNDGNDNSFVCMSLIMFSRKLHWPGAIYKQCSSLHIIVCYLTWIKLDSGARTKYTWVSSGLLENGNIAII